MLNLSTELFAERKCHFDLGNQNTGKSNYFRWKTSIFTHELVTILVNCGLNPSNWPKVNCHFPVVVFFSKNHLLKSGWQMNIVIIVELTTKGHNCALQMYAERKKSDNWQTNTSTSTWKFSTYIIGCLHSRTHPGGSLSGGTLASGVSIQGVSVLGRVSVQEGLCP